MINKRCPKCEEIKSIDNFSKCKSRKDGFSVYCKSCASIAKKKYYKETIEKQKEYREKNKEKYKNYSKNYYQENKNEIKEKSKKYYIENENQKKEYSKKYNNKNKEKIKERRKKYREINQEKIKEREKKFYIKNKENRINYQYKYKEEYPDKIKEWQSNYRKKNKSKIYLSKLEYNKKNPHIIAWRNILKNTLKRIGKIKEDRTNKMLGYSALELKEYIEKLFTPEMTWDNYGEWHIDHIKPVSSFNKDTNVSIVCSLDNLQPLWALTREINGIVYEGNLNKGNKTNG
ncbi:hypothetical protein M0Q97_10980 [Candidatus Dojkabacteria bacterium]|jgi:hypothetical protein|nr:hypothetical protein [Candidatus Dojkabacteria bacterium]